MSDKTPKNALRVEGVAAGKVFSALVREISGDPNLVGKGVVGAVDLRVTMDLTASSKSGSFRALFGSKDKHTNNLRVELATRIQVEQDS